MAYAVLGFFVAMAAAYVVAYVLHSDSQGGDGDDDDHFGC